MKREDKKQLIDNLTAQVEEYKHFYLTDTADLNAQVNSDLRRLCFKKEVKLVVVKNTLFKKALEQLEGNYDELFPLLKGQTAVMFCETGNAPAKLIKEFSKKHTKPVLKGAFVEESVYIGAEQLEALANLKSKEELLADVIALLQSPMKNVLGGLQSGGNKLSGILQTLSKKEE